MNGIVEFGVRASDEVLNRAKDIADIVVVIVAGHLMAYVALTSGYRCIVT